LGSTSIFSIAFKVSSPPTTYEYSPSQRYLRFRSWFFFRLIGLKNVKRDKNEAWRKLLGKKREWWEEEREKERRSKISQQK
jgi:hypothetical protein